MAHLSNRTLLAVAPVVLAPLTLASVIGLSASGCEAYHNEAEREAYQKEQEAREAKLYPGTGGSSGLNTLPYSYLQPGYNPPDPTQCPNNGTCLPDPGSRPVSAEECKAAEQGIEFMPLPIFDFDDDRSGFFYDVDKNRLRGTESSYKAEADQNEERFALLGYTYSDDTTFNYYPFGWEPPSILDPYMRCEKKDNYVFHISGGPFLEWGGGLGRSLRCMNNTSWTNTTPGQALIEKMREAKGFTTDNPADKELIYCHAGSNFGNTVRVPAACAVPETAPMGKMCPQRDRIYAKTKQVDPPEDEAVLGMAVDVSQWEGISFWARRGPNSQVGFRVLVGDKRTDDDISFMQYVRDPLAPRYCERAFECKCKSASRPCTKLTDEEASKINQLLNNGHSDTWESDPLLGNAYNISPANYKSALPEYALAEPGDSICWKRGNTTEDYALAARTMQYCGQSAARHQTDSAKSLNVGKDPYISDTTCQEFSFRGSITSDYLYNPNSEIPGQQKPYEGSQLCGDHWMRSVTLSTDWEFYKIPFTELLQQNWAKRSYWLDLTAVTLARFTWDRGYIDYYLDDVRFYRTCPNGKCPKTTATP